MLLERKGRDSHEAVRQLQLHARALSVTLPELHPAKRTWLSTLAAQLRACFPEQKQELLDGLVAKCDPAAHRILKLYARPDGGEGEGKEKGEAAEGAGKAESKGDGKSEAKADAASGEKKASAGKS